MEEVTTGSLFCSSCLTYLETTLCWLECSWNEVANESISDTLPVRPVPRSFDHVSNTAFAYSKSYDQSE